MGVCTVIDYAKLNEGQVESEIDTFTLERYRQFVRYLSPSVKCVLDVGCNTGRGGQQLKVARPELRVIGLDCVQSRLDRLSRDIYESCVCSYTSDIALPDNALDAVVAGEFIEHLAEDDVDTTLHEFYRVISNGGQLLLTTPNPDYLRLKITGGSVLGGAHLSQHFPDVLVERLHSCGFVNVVIRGSGKMTRILGDRLPIMPLYGSYLLVAQKPDY